MNRILGTHKMSDDGDSGSPVFRWLGTTVLLSGVSWGSPADHSAFLFSPIDQIERELGLLTRSISPNHRRRAEWAAPGESAAKPRSSTTSLFARCVCPLGPSVREVPRQAEEPMVRACPSP